TRAQITTFLPSTTLFRSEIANRKIRILRTIQGCRYAKIKSDTQIFSVRDIISSAGTVISDAKNLNIAKRYNRRIFGNKVNIGKRSEEHTSELQSRENLVC